MAEDAHETVEKRPLHELVDALLAISVLASALLHLAILGPAWLQPEPPPHPPRPDPGDGIVRILGLERVDQRLSAPSPSDGVAD